MEKKFQNFTFAETSVTISDISIQVDPRIFRFFNNALIKLQSNTNNFKVIQCFPSGQIELYTNAENKLCLSITSQDRDITEIISDRDEFISYLEVVTA